MRSHRILALNAVATAACAVGMLATRTRLHPLLALETPFVLDVVAVGLLLYAVALAWAARTRPVTRAALIAFTATDALWVVASAVLLVMFWSDIAPLARILVVAVAVVVEVFATLQFRAAGGAWNRPPQVA